MTILLLRKIITLISKYKDLNCPVLLKNIPVFHEMLKKYLKYFIKKIENCQDVHVLQNDCAKIQIPEKSTLQTVSVYM